jgi:peptidoglycan-associated lipoprotein
MRVHTRLAPVALMVAGSLALSACASKAPKELPPQPGGTSTSTTTGTGQGTAGSVTPGSQADFAAFTQGSDTIYFDTDRYNVDGVDAAALQLQAQWLARYPGKRATLEGHCDERGTRDYNLALGERRANAAKNYLVGLGIDPSRLTTVSYGKERPLAMGSDETAWSLNRRAVTITID